MRAMGRGGGRRCGTTGGGGPNGSADGAAGGSRGGGAIRASCAVGCGGGRGGTPRAAAALGSETTPCGCSRISYDSRRRDFASVLLMSVHIVNGFQSRIDRAAGLAPINGFVPPQTQDVEPGGRSFILIN